MESNEYKIQILEEDPIQADPQVKDKPIEFKRKPSLLETQGYIITPDKEGKNQQPIVFSLSNTTVDFGELKPSSHVENSVETSVTYSGKFGYQLSANVERPFQTFSGSVLSATTCAQVNPCTMELAKQWESKIYGVGYNNKGDDTSPDFVSEEFFRPLSDKTKNVVLNFNDYTEDQRKSMIKFDIKTPSQQPEGSYFTIVNIIAIPRL
jgi:hypothetical protein